MEKQRIPGELQPTHRCVVYNTKSGKVVHIHDFVGADEVGKSIDAAALREAAMAAEPRFKARDFAVVEVPTELINRTANYRVDPETLEVSSYESESNPLARRVAD